MNIQGIQVQNYIYHFLSDIARNYSLNGKNILFFHNSPDINSARVILKFGAKKVFFMSYNFGHKDLENENITTLDLADLGQLQNIEDNSIDVVIGLETLEHIHYIRGFIDEIKRIMRKGGNAILQGYPMWTGKNGHHIWLEDKFIFNNESNPLEAWEHLVFKNKEEAVTAMKDKGYNNEDSKIIAEWIFEENEINRFSPSEIFVDATKIPYNAEKFGQIKNNNGIVETYQTEDFSYNFKRIFTNERPNKFFEQALTEYKEEDLKTEELVLTITKKVPYEERIDKTQFEELPYFRKVVFEKFFQKYNLKGARVLNISYYENNFFSQILKKHGASSVVGVSPILQYKEYEETEGIENIAERFENLNITAEKFDIIIGFDVIQNIRNLNKFCITLGKYSNLSTGIHIDGYMPYTSACGHGLCSKNHNFFDETNPLDYWEHLHLNTEDDYRIALKNHNVPDDEIEEMIGNFVKENTVFKVSPEEVEKEISKNLTLDVRRIYKYFPKNEYYERALTKYGEDDLNAERLIITSDIPNLLRLDDLDIDRNYELNVSDVNLRYKLPKKRVLSISPHYCNFAMTEGLEALRAEEVVSLGAYYSGYEIRGGKNVKRVNQKWEDIENLRGKFDIIYGIEILEHVKDLKHFFETLISLLSDNGVIYVQGRPLWTSDDGHNYPYYLDCGLLQTGEENGKISAWQHLAFEKKEDLKKSLLQKEFTENDAEKISEYIFNSEEINRHSFSEILNILNGIDGIYYGARKVLDYSKENEFYAIASNKYTHEELRTKELTLTIRKKT